MKKYKNIKVNLTKLEIDWLKKQSRKHKMSYSEIIVLASKLMARKDVAEGKYPMNDAFLYTTKEQRALRRGF